MQILAVPVDVPDISTSKYCPFPTDIDPVPVGCVLPKTLDSTCTLVLAVAPVIIVSIPVLP